MDLISEDEFKQVHDDIEATDEKRKTLYHSTKKHRI